MGVDAMFVVKLLGIVALAGYFWMALKFWKGYQLTNFQPRVRAMTWLVGE